MGNVVELILPEKTIEHVDSTTIVERTEWTDEIRAKFERAYGRSVVDSGPVADDASAGDKRPPPFRYAD